MKYRLQYLFFGLISNAALDLYYKAPREAIQDEFFNLHRWALKKAHRARVKIEHGEQAF